jgi:hypothetical protein
LATFKVADYRFGLGPLGISIRTVGDRKLAANSFCEEVADFSMTAGEDAGGVPQASSDYDELLLGVGREVRKDSWRRYSRIRAIASRRFAKHSSRDLP